MLSSALQTACEALTSALAQVLSEGGFSLYLYGSVPLGDYRPGWSDIDVLALTASPLTDAQAEELVSLRQTLVQRLGDPLYRSFEGAVLPLPAFLSGESAKVVYWGTSGQRMDTHYAFDSFCLWELTETGLLLHGPEVRARLPRADGAQFAADAARYLTFIRRYARETDDSLYACGWLLDIARCLYSLETGRVTSKTGAGSGRSKGACAPTRQSCARPLRSAGTPSHGRTRRHISAGPRGWGLRCSALQTF